jgi:hypothetical protein
MFRFTIRDVLWLTALVAMGLGWLQTTRRLSSVEAERQALETTFKSMKTHAAKARMDEYFRRAYDGPGASRGRGRFP